ncbi:MAG TPA: helicase-associated domain-containing protein [Nocardioidaceae bacterium]|nr:helicase-associated domain-containing protein [Nocardioidaceae bacterium]
MSSSAPRTLADQLRSWSDASLAALLEARPDLASPAPQDTAQLASRAGTKASVLRAADGLNLLELAVLDAVVVLGGVAAPQDLQRVVHADAGSIDAAIARLSKLALLWGADPLRSVSIVAEAIGTPVSGLGTSNAQLEALLEERGGHTTTVAVDVPPALATSSRDSALVDRTAAGAAFELVRHVELLLELWGTRPPAALRAGGVGVRDLKAASVLMHVDERVAALLIETASAAGLLAVGHTDELDAAWLPTEAFDHWLAAPVADQWARLALAWLDNPRLGGMVGSRQQGKVVTALSPDLERSWLATTRRETLGELASLAAGEVLAAGTGVPSLVDRLRWLRPRRPATRAEAVAWTVEEAAALGVVGLGGLSSHGRALVTADDPLHEAPSKLQPLLPTPVDQVMVQADLTAVAPGPLEQELARNLATVADVESRGGATVYRFTESSVRRAFDSGWSLAEVHAFLEASSATGVPQPLSYLVDDVSRKFGSVRVGAVESFLRSDDEGALAELVHDTRAASLRLRRIAPTVVVSDVPVDVLLPRLRELGVAPVVEAPDGTVRLARKEVFRARVPSTRPRPAEAARTVARAAAVVTAVRAGDRATASRPAEARRATPVSALAALREAAETKTSMWISYVDNDGSTMERVVDPVRVEAGWLTAYDHRTEGNRSFAVHRIVAVRALEG